MSDDITVIAVTGKGGTGKTIFTYLLSRHLVRLGIYPLLIDADPTMSHLSRLLDQKPEKSLETIRKQVIKAAIKSAANAVFTILEVFSMLSILVFALNACAAHLLLPPECGGKKKSEADQRQNQKYIF